MALETYPYAPIVVDLPDHPQANVKLRARRAAIRILDSPDQPLSMDVELIPYERLPDGSYGPELRNSVFTRKLCAPLTVNKNRLVDATTGRILASRIAADGTYRPDADWLADVARLEADDTVTAMPQADWFLMLLARGLPTPIDVFSQQYILLAYASGDLV